MRTSAWVFCAAASASPVAAETVAPTLNFYGVPGLIEMPTAESLPDGELAATFSYFGGISRSTLTFQIAPRLSGSFRYTGIEDWSDVVASEFDTYYDRSFDLRYQILNEGQYTPAVTVGLQDFIGTGIYSAEYLVATKHLSPKFTVTGGLGWGRLGSLNDIGSPFSSRPELDVGEGGSVDTGQWFRGPAAPFAGVQWNPTDRWSVLAEYSSDAYDIEDDERGVIDRKSPFNFGLSYKVNDSLRLGAYSLYGSELGLSAEITLNPKRPPVAGVNDNAPAAVEPRPAFSVDPEAWGLDWTQQPDAPDLLRRNTAKWLEADGLGIEAMQVTGNTVQIWINNPIYDAEAQAVGRVARALTNTMPASVETFQIVPVVNGIPASAVTLNRRDVEAFENAPDGARAILSRAVVSDALAVPADVTYDPARYPRFRWALSPYLYASFFDPESPLRADFGARLSSKFELAPGLQFSGSVTKSLGGNISKDQGENTSQLPHVRSNSQTYLNEGDPALEHLTAAYFFRPAPDFYGRVTGGYLERMFGGVSGEVLWKPVDSRFALGAEVNYAKQRDFDSGFGFQDYDVFTGHLSAYYDAGRGYQLQVDAGRYLAGDYGATFTLQREFANGWKVGAFATFTDVSAEEFGEGSFDKGIMLEMPLSWFSGKSSRNSFQTTLRPLTRDGGARLNVNDRLYGTVRDYHQQGLEAQWGRFWR